MKPLIRVNGQPADPNLAADLLEVEPGVYSILLDGSSYEASITGAEIHIDGQALRVERDDPRKWNPASSARKSEGREAIKAPMPGKVVRILVAEGDQVTVGQGLLVVEAMKMQNEMKAPRVGRVVSIAVKEHEAITAGSVLVTIE